MHSVQILSALLAVGAGVVSGASTTAASASTCTGDITITQATPVISCDVVDANVIVDPSLGGSVTINGPQSITGNVVVSNATQLVSLSSNTIQAIQGNLTLTSLTLLSSLTLSSLSSVGGITLSQLPQLSTLGFSTQGISQADNVQVSDTFLSSLNGINIDRVESFIITNNGKLTSWNSSLVNVTALLSITSNGNNNMAVSLPDLEKCTEMHLSNVQSLDTPSLNTMTGSIKFDTNTIESFSADNLTSIGDSVTFINNNQLTNISFSSLTTIGDMTIQNNTALQAITGYPKLKTINGGMILRGNFSNVTLPSLNDVKGGVTVTSTTDISSFCNFFNDLKKNGDIQGSETCTSNNANANSGGNGGTSSTGASNNSTESAAGAVGVNMAAFGLAVFAGMATLY